MDSNYSLSDLAAATGGNGLFGGSGGGAWLIIILLFFMMGGGAWGNRQGEFGQYATAASQNEILLGQKFEGISRQINQVGDGLASSTFALNNAITTEGRALQSQLADCCCSNKEATAQVRYDMANFAAQINSNIDNKFAALEKQSLEQTIAAQNARINQLELASAVGNVVRYPTGMTYTAGTSPFCNCNCNGF